MLTNEEVNTSSANLLIDDVGPDQPLIISFGYYAVDNNPQFDFFGRLKKLEQLTGRPLGKLLLRDTSQLWYLSGIPGIAQGVDETCAALSNIIRKLKPSSVVTIGQSMGAYAAIVYGARLACHKAIAFGPLSCFDDALWRQMGDARWKAQLDLLTARGIDYRPYHDLASFLPSLGAALPQIDLIYGANPGVGALAHEATGLDVPHAMRLSGLPKLDCLPALSAGHAVVEYFRANGVISDVVRQRLFGHPLSACMERLHQSDPWLGWLSDNLAQGCSEAQLRATMLENNLDESSIAALVAKARLIPTLHMLDAQPPSFII